jgi:hypothetical protein
MQCADPDQARVVEGQPGGSGGDALWFFSLVIPAALNGRRAGQAGGAFQRRMPVIHFAL